MKPNAQPSQQDIYVEREKQKLADLLEKTRQLNPVACSKHAQGAGHSNGHSNGHGKVVGVRPTKNEKQRE